MVRAGDVLGKQFNQEFIARKEAAQRQLIVAEKEAGKTLEIEVAELAALVAKSELDRVRQANRDMPGAIAEEDEVKRVYEYNRAYKSWEKAKYDLGIKADEVEVRKAEILIADAQLEERKLISPIEGQIDDIYQNEGQWLREGDKVFRVIRLDKIQVEARFDASKTSPDAPFRGVHRSRQRQDRKRELVPDPRDARSGGRPPVRNISAAALEPIAGSASSTS